METQNQKNPIKSARNTELNARLEAAGFKPGKRLGMNILKQAEGETVIIEVEGPIAKWTSKTETDKVTHEPKVYDYVLVTNVETGEENMTYWLSGQIRYQFEELEKAGGYVGKTFAITSLGKTTVDGNQINQFEIMAVNN